MPVLRSLRIRIIFSGGSLAAVAFERALDFSMTSLASMMTWLGCGEISRGVVWFRCSLGTSLSASLVPFEKLL